MSPTRSNARFVLNYLRAIEANRHRLVNVAERLAFAKHTFQVNSYPGPTLHDNRQDRRIFSPM